MRDMTTPLIELALADAAATEALGARLAEALRGVSGWVVFLHGELGAGKTTLVRAWLRTLGVAGTIRSPTYTLIEPYEIDGRSLLHLDLYRLQDAEELEQLGLADTPPSAGGWLVEWPQRGAGLLPPPAIEIHLRADGLGRKAASACADLWRERLAARLTPESGSSSAYAP